jgi:hypothetical protein
MSWTGNKSPRWIADFVAAAKAAAKVVTLTTNRADVSIQCWVSRRLVLPFILFFIPFVSAEVVPYGGTIGGVATLSADAASQMSGNGLSSSSYSPHNGGAVNIFAGVQLHNYFALQANYIWNENNLLLSSTSSGSNTFYQESRSSSQQAVIGDFLIYFRKSGSRMRPYLGTGGGFSHLSSTQRRLLSENGDPALPPSSFSSNGPVFRSHVGIDLRVARRVDFRYSFSETIGKNDISKNLSPPASRRLANFQNLFGFVFRF